MSKLTQIEKDTALIEAIIKPRAEAFTIAQEEAEMIFDLAARTGIDIFNQVVKYFHENNIIVTEKVVSWAMENALCHRHSDIAHEIFLYQKQFKIVPSQESLGRIFDRALLVESGRFISDILNYAEISAVTLESLDLLHAMQRCTEEKYLIDILKILIDYKARNNIVVLARNITWLLEQTIRDDNRDAVDLIMTLPEITSMSPEDFGKFISNLLTQIASRNVTHGFDIVIGAAYKRGIEPSMDIIFPAIEAAAHRNQQYVLQTLLDQVRDRKFTSNEIVQILLATITNQSEEIAVMMITYGTELTSGQVGSVVQRAAKKGWHQLISHLITYLDGRGLVLSPRVVDVSAALATSVEEDAIAADLRQYAIAHHIQM